MSTAVEADPQSAQDASFDDNATRYPLPSFAATDGDARLTCLSSPLHSCAIFSPSVALGVQEYIFENGRRYHSYFGVDKYLMPTDEREQERMDIAHEMFFSLFDGQLHKAPLADNPQNILDVGTGTGIWAVDMADKHPGAMVLGIDLSPIQPTWIPDNCRFEIDDAEREWAYSLNTFDLIHIRNLDQGIRNWPKVLAEASRCLKPGSYLELSETSVIFQCDDGTMTKDTPAYRWSALMEEAMAKAGRPAIRQGQLEQRLKDAGYEDIHAFSLKLPFGPWTKEQQLKALGWMALLGVNSAFQAYGMAAFTRILGMSAEEAEKVCSEGLASVKTKRKHVYVYHYVAYGRKPKIKIEE
ncbi:TAM domain methyltransferase [Sphaerosporella brunnea]|uniref:TAM domain methyltransferase n=1 Tax=Sphaerosporella brunnea TaxID=1250544 RepID=A0A5J5F0A8_9PEZI|nr:TAM domain methyltransferase [Sphaerosporella brunnea]